MEEVKLRIKGMEKDGANRGRREKRRSYGNGEEGRRRIKKE